ncbi:hypothetical protein SBA5_1240004 [Candidatus Sulfotelmatomonas gaucii]|uniref:Uncharacterized protein n=1 Tax=Candidatus Sulfuritelmatomonas gaucii TaxID=2043161 RepID=A0A2N9L4Z1_9BACT|nr:hypothetical protein SBA5_1240004 [Candidatus Sulfotelmatomonas gaucii]
MVIQARNDPTFERDSLQAPTVFTQTIVPKEVSIFCRTARREADFIEQFRTFIKAWKIDLDKRLCYQYRPENRFSALNSAGSISGHQLAHTEIIAISQSFVYNQQMT